MKNHTTPRNYADCTWVQGYGRKEPLLKRMAPYALGFLIGSAIGGRHDCYQHAPHAISADRQARSL